MSDLDIEIKNAVAHLTANGIEINAANIRTYLQSMFSSETIDAWISQYMTVDIQLEVMLNHAKAINSYGKMLEFIGTFVNYLINAAPYEQREALKEIKRVAFRNPLEKK